MRKILLGAVRLMLLMLCMTMSVFIGYQLSEVSKIVNNPRQQYSEYVHYIQVERTVKDQRTGEDKKVYGGGTAFRLKLKNRIVLVSAGHVCDSAKTVHVFRELSDTVKDDDGREELKVLKQDIIKDICIIENFKEVKYNTGLELNEEPVHIGTKHAFLGFPESHNLYVGEGELMGAKTVYGLEHPDIDHVQMNDFRFSKPLTEKQKEKICTDKGKDNKLIKQAEMTLMNMFTGEALTVSYHSCMIPQHLAQYSFKVSMGASGSPVINLQTGKVVGVVIIRDEGFMGYGLTQLRTDLIKFVEEFNK